MLLLYHFFVKFPSLCIKSLVILGEFESLSDLLINYRIFFFLLSLFLSKLLFFAVEGGQWIVNLHFLPASLVVFGQFFLIKCDMLSCLAVLCAFRLENWID